MRAHKNTNRSSVESASPMTYAPRAPRATTSRARVASARTETRTTAPARCRRTAARSLCGAQSATLPRLSASNKKVLDSDGIPRPVERERVLPVPRVPSFAVAGNPGPFFAGGFKKAFQIFRGTAKPQQDR